MNDKQLTPEEIALWNLQTMAEWNAKLNSEGVVATVAIGVVQEGEKLKVQICSSADVSPQTVANLFANCIRAIYTGATTITRVESHAE